MNGKIGSFPLHRVEEIVVDVLAGTSIEEVIHDARQLAGIIGHHSENAMPSENGGTVIFNFNTVRVRVRMDTDPTTLRREWQRAFCGLTESEVGPYPPQMTPSEEAEYLKAQIELRG